MLYIYIFILYILYYTVYLRLPNRGLPPLPIAFALFMVKTSVILPGSGMVVIKAFTGIRDMVHIP